MSTKIFIHRPHKIRRAPPHPIVVHEDPEKQRARVAAERRERERIAADRRRRMLERSVARALSSTALKDQSDRDAEWFAAHPGRDHYVRQYVKGEAPPPFEQLGCGWMVVRQIEPGMRIRLPFNIKEHDKILDDAAVDEAAAKVVFESLVECLAERGK